MELKEGNGRRLRRKRRKGETNEEQLSKNSEMYIKKKS